MVTIIELITAITSIMSSTLVLFTAPPFSLIIGVFIVMGLIGYIMRMFRS